MATGSLTPRQLRELRRKARRVAFGIILADWLIDALNIKVTVVEAKKKAKRSGKVVNIEDYRKGKK